MTSSRQLETSRATGRLDEGTSDYRLIIRIKNNLLYQLMRREGIKTQSELARATGIHASTIGDIANLKMGAFNANGEPSSATQKLCDYFGCLPEDIYPLEVLRVGIPSNVVERVVSSEEVAKHLQQAELDPAYQLENTLNSEFIEKRVISRLTPREQKVIKARFFHDETRGEVAESLGVSSARIKQIEERAILRLKRIIFAHEPNDYDADDATATGLETRLADAIKNEEAKAEL